MPLQKTATGDEHLLDDPERAHDHAGILARNLPHADEQIEPDNFAGHS